MRLTTPGCLLYTIVLLISATGCKKNEETALERTNRLLMSATWKLSKLTIDGTDRTSLYPDMVLTVSSGIYNCENGYPVWPASGTWLLVDETTIDRDDMVVVRIDLLDAKQLTLSFDWIKTTYGGRATSVSGRHVFELVAE